MKATDNYEYFKAALKKLGQVEVNIIGAERQFVVIFSEELDGCRVYFNSPGGVKGCEFPLDPLEDWPEFSTLLSWADGGPGLLQNIAPELSSDLREFLISGIRPEEWNELFPAEMETLQ